MLSKTVSSRMLQKAFAKGLKSGMMRRNNSVNENPCALCKPELLQHCRTVEQSNTTQALIVLDSSLSVFKAVYMCKTVDSRHRSMWLARPIDLGHGHPSLTVTLLSYRLPGYPKCCHSRPEMIEIQISANNKHQNHANTMCERFFLQSCRVSRS